MAATPVTVVQPSRTGVAPAVEVACDIVEGNTVPNKRGLHLVLHSTDAGPQTVTFTTPATVGGYAVADPQVTLAAGETKHLAGFPTDVFGGNLEFTASAVTVMVAAYNV